MNGKRVLWIIILLIAIILLAFSINYTLQKEETGEVGEVVEEFVKPTKPFSSSVKIPAVNQKGEGAITFLNVEVAEGSGKTLTDIDNLLFWADTQNSIRIARMVAANITRMDLSNHDIIFSLIANASLVGGESAGAAITIATIAALKGAEIDNSVMITGVINHDGSIGPVSNVVEKAQVAKDANAKIFLVPLLQSREVIYETKKHCEKFGWTEFCTVEQIPKKIKVEEKADIVVKEVENIKEALSYYEIEI